jgi:hypothetical protein
MQIQMLKRLGGKEPDVRGLLLVVLVGGWLVGIIANAWLLLSPSILLLLALLALLLAGLCWRLPGLRLGALVLLCICLGAWRSFSVAPVNDAYAIRAYINSTVLEVQGTVADDPRLESTSTLITVAVEKVSLDRGQSWRQADGQIQVQALGATFDDPYAPHYGDTLQLEGRLTSPPGYATPELQASMTFPRLSIDNRGGNPFLTFFYQVRSTLAGMLIQTLPQPCAALMIALFLSLL